MTRRRRHDVVVFDLDLDASDAPTPAAAPQPDERTPDDESAPPDEPAAPSRMRMRRIREGIAAATVVVLAVAAWGVTAAVREHQRVERLLAAPGGVLSLAHAPTEAWSADTGASGQALFLPGIVAVRRGAVLHGLDAVTGDERWQVEIGGDPQCGVAAGRGNDAAVVDPVVCWSGPNSATPTVTVVHGDGSSSTRTLDEEFDAIGPAADGGLVTARRVGPAPAAPDIDVTGSDTNGWSFSGSIDEGQDVVVRLEDATTGGVRWERTVPFRPVADVNSCASLSFETTDSGIQGHADVGYLQVAAYPGLVTVHGCGVDGGFTLTGEPTYDASQSAWSWLEPYAEGGALEQVGGYLGDTDAASVLHAADGALVGTFPDQVLNPMATDGSATDTVLTGSGGASLTAVGRDGTQRWRDPHIYQTLLVRTADVAMLLRTDQTVSGVDLRTGAVLWTDDDLLTADPSGTDWPAAAFTDGTVAAIAISPAGGGKPSLVGLDLATGTVRWRTPLDGDYPSVAAAEGRLVESVPTGESWTRQDDDGSYVRDQPGTVRMLH